MRRDPLNAYSECSMYKPGRKEGLLHARDAVKMPCVYDNTPCSIPTVVPSWRFLVLPVLTLHRRGYMIC